MGFLENPSLPQDGFANFLDLQTRHSPRMDLQILWICKPVTPPGWICKFCGFANLSLPQEFFICGISGLPQGFEDCLLGNLNS